jgi:hypothetical protein
VSDRAGLARLLTLTLTPFIDLDNRVGGQHRYRRAVCLCVDLVIRFAVVLLLLAIPRCPRVETLAPLPEFWSDR